MRAAVFTWVLFGVVLVVLPVVLRLFAEDDDPPDSSDESKQVPLPVPLAP